MNYSKPTLFVISGPNGAGKSTHIQSMLPDELAEIWSFDRDTNRLQFEDQLRELNTPKSQITAKATRLMEVRLREEMLKAIGNKQHFVLETPLSHPDYWHYIDLFEHNNYQIQLSYLCLDRISDCIGRVGQRVFEGGHFVEPNTIKGVYQKNLEHINNYFNIFNVIELYDGMKIPTLLARLEESNVSWASKFALEKLWIKRGLPNLALKIANHLQGKRPEM